MRNGHEVENQNLRARFLPAKRFKQSLKFTPDRFLTKSQRKTII